MYFAVDTAFRTISRCYQDQITRKDIFDMGIDLDKCVQAKRLHGRDKHKRDLIIYFLWNKGSMNS